MTPDDFTATFTGLLFLATFALWYSTRGLVKGAEETAQKQLRAYMVMSRACIEQKGNGWQIRAIFENVGETPAYNVQQVVSVSIKDTQSAMTFEHVPSPEIASRSICGRNKTIHAVCAIDLLDSDKADIIVGKKCIYAYGILTYADIFHISRFTKFRVELSKGWKNGDNLISSAEGNEADFE